jgi:hypothetical protein
MPGHSISEGNMTWMSTLLHSTKPRRSAGPLAELMAISLILLPAAGGQAHVTAPPTPSTSIRHTQYAPSRFPKRAAMYYEWVWGIDSLTVRSTESGELVRFSYRVLNEAKAKQLNDKKSEPALIDPRAGVKLVVPSLEKVGQLRQSSTPETGMNYWMAFSNPKRTVKRGDRVNVVIGSFHADGLIVE